jgi:hypothetical protein
MCVDYLFAIKSSKFVILALGWIPFGPPNRNIKHTSKWFQISWVLAITWVFYVLATLITLTKSVLLQQRISYEFEWSIICRFDKLLVEFQHVFAHVEWSIGLKNWVTMIFV